MSLFWRINTKRLVHVEQGRPRREVWMSTR